MDINNKWKFFWDESEASWNGIIKGYHNFPDEKTIGAGTSFEGTNGVIISNWEGVFTTDDDDNGEQLAFKGRDINKNGKFVVLRTYSTDSTKLSWINTFSLLITKWKNYNWYWIYIYLNYQWWCDLVNQNK